MSLIPISIIVYLSNLAQCTLSAEKHDLGMKHNMMKRTYTNQKGEKQFFA